MCCSTLFTWNILVRLLFHYSYRYSNAAFAKLRKRSYFFEKLQDQPKPKLSSFSPNPSHPITRMEIFNEQEISEPTESSFSTPKEFDVTFVSQGTYEINHEFVVIPSLNRWDYMLEITSLWKGYSNLYNC